MFNGFTQVNSVTSAAPEINKAFQLSDASGCVEARSLPRITKVEVDFASALRIAKHANGMKRFFEGGQLFGLQLNEVLEVGYTLPDLPSLPTVDDDESKAQQERNSDIEQSMKAVLKENAIDTNPVGMYTICTGGSVFHRQNVVRLREMVDRNQPAVMLFFDHKRSAKGKLYLRAFTLSQSYIQYHRHKADMARAQAASAAATKPGGPTPATFIEPSRRGELKRETGVYMDGIFTEVRVEIRSSIAHQLLMANYIPTPVLPRVADTVNDNNLYLQGLLNNFSRGTFNLNMEITNGLQRSEEVNRRRRIIAESEGGAALDAVLKTDARRNPNTNVLLLLEGSKDQAMHIEAACDSILMNSTVVRKL